MYVCWISKNRSRSSIIFFLFCLKFSGSITACFSARAVKKNKQTTKNKKPQKLLEQLFKLKEKKKKRLPFFYFAFVFGPKKKIDQAGPIFSVATKVMRRKKTVFGLILLIFQCKLREGKSQKNKGCILDFKISMRMGRGWKQSKEKHVQRWGTTGLVWRGSNPMSSVIYSWGAWGGGGGGRQKLRGGPNLGRVKVQIFFTFGGHTNWLVSFEKLVCISNFSFEWFSFYTKAIYLNFKRKKHCTGISNKENKHNVSKTIFRERYWISKECFLRVISLFLQRKKT